jgi:energy-coupling factor transport system ATP-binding protein
MTQKGFQVCTDNLTFKYSEKIIALKNISLNLIAGERVALVGHNGSGKSTLARQFNGLLRPFAGKAWIQGIDASTQSVSQLAKRVALLFQNPDDQICKRTVRDEVGFGPKNLGYSEKKIDQLVNKALSSFDLLPFQKTNPHDLGFSERKRTALASILAMDTPIIVFDEPTAGFDSHEINLFVTTLQRLRDEGKTVLIITHDMDFVAENTTRILCLLNGEKVFDGNAQNFFSDNALLSNCRLLPPQVVRLSTRFQQKRLAVTPEEFIELA